MPNDERNETGEPADLDEQLAKVADDPAVQKLVEKQQRIAQRMKAKRLAERKNRNHSNVMRRMGRNSRRRNRKR